MSTEKYYTFEIQTNGAGGKRHLFTPELYFNRKVKISSTALVHLHFSTVDYYLFFWNTNPKTHKGFSFQCNHGHEFVEMLKSKGATYYRYDVEKVLEASYFYTFQLTNKQIIQWDTYANGTTSGLKIFDVSEPNQEGKELAHLPIAKLDLDAKNTEITLVSTEESEPNEMPHSFNEFVEKSEWKTTDTLYLSVGLAVIFAILYYYFS